MTQSLIKFGHVSHIKGVKRSKKLIQDNKERWSNYLDYWLEKYKAIKK